jgi:hypothetical protein
MSFLLAARGRRSPSGADGVPRADDICRVCAAHAGAAHRVRLSRVGRAPQGEANAREASPRRSGHPERQRAAATPPTCAQAGCGRAHVWEGSARAGRRPSTTRVGNPGAEHRAGGSGAAAAGAHQGTRQEPGGPDTARGGERGAQHRRGRLQRPGHEAIAVLYGGGERRRDDGGVEDRDGLGDCESQRWRATRGVVEADPIDLVEADARVSSACVRRALERGADDGDDGLQVAEHELGGEPYDVVVGALEGGGPGACPTGAGPGCGGTRRPPPR